MRFTQVFSRAIRRLPTTLLATSQSPNLGTLGTLLPPPKLDYTTDGQYRTSLDTPMPTITKNPLNDWCCTASVDVSSDRIALDRVSGYEMDVDEPFRSVDGHEKEFDLTASPDWMEYIERSEDRMDDDGGAGAYDTLRCDLVLTTSTNRGDRFKIWGEGYHLDRLEKSFASITEESSSVTGDSIAVARKISAEMMQTLLSEAASSGKLQTAETPSGDDVVIQLIRMTWLWSLDKSSDHQNSIVVRGHACSNARSMRVHRTVDPIVVSVAAKSTSPDQDQNAVTLDKSMPSRFSDPEKKVAKWTRLRKEMEKPGTGYKPPGVSEVLLVRPASESSSTTELEVLEGLSSNFFAIYKDGTVRTAQDGVLFGYVRTLVLESADACGLRVDSRPILLQDADQWKEAFITSSSRLIFPISKVLTQAEGGSGEFVEYWSDPTLTGELTAASAAAKRPKWQMLLDEILRRGGYEPLDAETSTME